VGWFLDRSASAIRVFPRRPPVSFRTAWFCVVMIEQLSLEDWAWQLATDVYRLNLYSHLTGRTVPNRSSVTEEELAGAIRHSFAQVNEAAYREMVKLATDAALEAYDRVVSCQIRRSRAYLAN
jgi:hypothetical protein